MSRKRPKNAASSIRERLLNLSKQRGEENQSVLTRYALERYLYRLSRSKYKTHFILKGALLFSAWTDTVRRPTRDADFLGSEGDSIASLEILFKEVCRTQAGDDGLSFDEDSVHGQRIREDQPYQGVRVTLTAQLATAMIPVQLDVGLGDAVTPRPKLLTLPTLLDFPPPRLKGYPPETAVAEKCETMVRFGIVNSRMKDYYDIWTMMKLFDFDAPLLARAIKRTFDRRKTQIPKTAPVALTDDFSTDAQKQAQWKGFLRKSGLQDAPADLKQVVDAVSCFLSPPLLAASGASLLEMKWSKNNWSKRLR